MKEFNINECPVELDINEIMVINTVVSIVKPLYKNNDDAHKIGHALDVMYEALRLNEVCGFKVPHIQIILASLFHDTYSSEDRHAHHLKGARYYSILSPVFNLDKKTNDAIIAAIREHRASYTGVRKSNLSKLISTADIGKPDLKNMIERSLKYNKGDMGEVIKHMKEKFGRDGYANYSPIYKEIYKKEIEKLWDEIDLL